jgi:beta-glucanase (GH16 family)
MGLRRIRARMISMLCLAGLGAAVGVAVHAGETQIARAATAGQRLDLRGYSLVFNEEFDTTLDVSAWGPNTRWIAHTPWNGDFGDAVFADPKPDFPFTLSSGRLRIEARKFSDIPTGERAWRSGLLSSNAMDGSGFSLKYGYFEMSAQLPGSPGVWPAFWLASTRDHRDPHTGDEGQVEIDIFEYYGHDPGVYHEVLHVWKPEPRATEHVVRTPKRDATRFHTYGALVTPEWIILYRDRRETWRTPTPPEHKRPLMILLNLALGSGWPIDKVANPSYMYVDYVRAYAPTATPQAR